MAAVVHSIMITSSTALQSMQLAIAFLYVVFHHQNENIADNIIMDAGKKQRLSEQFLYHTNTDYRAIDCTTFFYHSYEHAFFSRVAQLVLIYLNCGSEVHQF